MNKVSRKISASMMCADPYFFKNDLELLEKYKIDYLHIDIMDGHFVPNFGLSLDYVKSVRTHCNIPCDFHLMVENPINIIPLLNLRENDIVSVHFESTYYLRETLDLIRTFKCKLFIAINPGTPIIILDKMLPYIDGVNFMTIHPGFAGQKILESSFKKAARLFEYLDSHYKSNFEIEVDGNMNFINTKIFADYGASIFVVGTSSIFPNNLLSEDRLKKLKNIIC